MAENETYAEARSALAGFDEIWQRVTERTPAPIPEAEALCDNGAPRGLIPGEAGIAASASQRIRRIIIEYF